MIIIIGILAILFVLYFLYNIGNILLFVALVIIGGILFPHINDEVRTAIALVLTAIYVIEKNDR